MGIEIRVRNRDRVKVEEGRGLGGKGERVGTVTQALAAPSKCKGRPRSCQKKRPKDS